MKTAEKTNFRKLLLAQRDEIRLLSNFRGEPRQQSEGVLDSADLAAGSAECEVAEEIEASESKYLDKIDLALYRLDDGTYGICEDCDGKIPIARLRAKPAATRCLDCQITNEQHEAAQRQPRRLVSIFD